MILHGITSKRWNNFQLFSLGEVTGKYSTPVTLIIAVTETIRNKFHDLISGQPLSCQFHVIEFELY